MDSSGWAVGSRLGAVLIAVIVGLVGYAVWTFPSEFSGLSDHAIAELQHAGTSNPVTAVLLNYRSYDTLLEMAVLLLAVLAAWALVGGGVNEVCLVSEVSNPVLRGFVRVMTPLSILVSAHLLWLGDHAPGGAFQAGAILASAGVVLFMAGIDWSHKLPAWLERVLLTIGLFAFTGVGIVLMLTGRSFLEYPPATAKWLILMIEVFCGVSIAAALVSVFLGGRLRSRQTVLKKGS